jgi:alkanesulfonate monooxygenase SsuD/methylene tetrahydromethanopterin reductase-like flavin-dependent oxidoreductase (luciferase family)
MIQADDVHWADTTSLALLHYLVRAADAEGLCVVVVAAARSAPGPESFARSLRQLVGDRSVTMELGPLGHEESVRLVIGANPGLDQRQADEVVRLAARLADGWNGWGMEPEGFAAKCELLREAADGRDPEPTWAGIVLVGEDEVEAERLRAARREKGMVEEGVWIGGAERFAEFADALEQAGARWLIAVPAGPPDRPDVIASALGTAPD